MPLANAQSLSIPSLPFLLVTVGTTKFEQLITEIVTNPSKILQAIAPFNIQTIILQIGSSQIDLHQFELSLQAHCEKLNKPTITVHWIDYHPDLKEYLQQAALVISHAGAGTILERLRGGTPSAISKSSPPLFVVINDALMDNHQQELAEAFSQNHYLYFSHCTNCLEQLLLCDWTTVRLYPQPSSNIFLTAVAQTLHPEDDDKDKNH